MVKITPTDGVQIIANGSDKEGILCVPSKKLKPIIYQPTDNFRKVMLETIRLLHKGIAADPASRAVVIGWFLTLPLLDYYTPRPLVRFEGSSQVGKTTATSLISNLFYGTGKQKTGTVAANWRDAGQNSLLLIDNLEAANLTSAQLDFLLLAADGTAREKCSLGSAFDCVSTEVHCLVLSTGIEPFPVEKQELLTRSLVIPLAKEFKSRNFSAAETIHALRSGRSSFFSAWFQTTFEVQKLIKAGEWTQIREFYEDDGQLVGKERLREFLALSQLYCRILDLEELFSKGLCQQTITFDFSQKEGHPIGIALEAFMDTWTEAKRIDQTRNSVINQQSEQE